MSSLSLRRLSQRDQEALIEAIGLLEHPTLAARVADVIGNPIEHALAHLPDQWSAKIGAVTQSALSKCLNVSIKTLDLTHDQPSSSRGFHKALVATAGGLGGLGGFSTIALELPISTGVIFRSIADIARSHGEDVTSAECQLACLEVFALGGPSDQDDGAESGYFAIRLALAQALREATRHFTRGVMVKESAPVLTRLISLIAERFSVQLTEKVAAQLVPVLGALGGAAINTIFIDHFQRMAEGHFTIRRLERAYGERCILDHYTQQLRVLRLERAQFTDK